VCQWPAWICWDNCRLGAAWHNDTFAPPCVLHKTQQSADIRFRNTTFLHNTCMLTFEMLFRNFESVKCLCFHHFSTDDRQEGAPNLSSVLSWIRQERGRHLRSEMQGRVRQWSVHEPRHVRVLPRLHSERAGQLRGDLPVRLSLRRLLRYLADSFCSTAGRVKSVLLQ
jgi:hypothetical protein